jgi:hypothetical protein
VEADPETPCYPVLASVHVEEPRQLTSDCPAEVVLTRPRLRWFDRVRKYKVAINGVTTGHTISNGEAIRFALPPGTHNLAMRIDWTGSRPLTLTLGSGEVCHLTVERLGDLFSTEQYLRLTQQEKGRCRYSLKGWQAAIPSVRVVASVPGRPSGGERGGPDWFAGDGRPCG